MVTAVVVVVIAVLVMWSSRCHQVSSHVPFALFGQMLVVQCAINTSTSEGCNNKKKKREINLIFIGKTFCCFRFGFS